MSRTTTAFASDYQRTREQIVLLPRGETRTLTADFNGVLAYGETITSATWRLSVSGVLSAAAIAEDGKSTSVLLQAATANGAIKVDATTSAGRVLPLVFRLGVRSSPWFNGESAIQSGPQSITVSV